MWPNRSIQVHFATKQGTDYGWCRKLDDQVRLRLLADGRFVSAYGLPENAAKRLMFHATTSSWPLYGVKGSEFEHFSVNADYVGGARTMSLWISINFRTADRYSKNFRDLKALISDAIGEEAMHQIEVKVEVEDIFPHLGDGA
jgi:hypothetical protein